ncbi:DMT family transporter [Lutimonas zeaxanthinifaciens]|uniref:DMT family transporter n=1 Tax=Lutimonas zeaxanthinifaciens TaxID=3060215 RepID=UPI00265D37D1|nr:DMT family transporter [Lutimonas sp. YSD2104]WKK66545.1 DMT family transporter [Lutimonas sp. YSD2104]
MNSKQSRWFILIVLSLIWGSSFILMKLALIDLSPVQVGALRIIFSALALFLIALKKIKRINRKEWIYIVLTALLGTFFPVFLFAYAVENIDSSIVSILNSLTPLNTLMVGAFFFGFSFLRKQFLGVIIGLLGALFLILKGAELNPDQNYLYALAIVIASVGYAFNVNIIKRHLSELSALTIVTGNFVVIFIPALIVLWMTDFFEVSYMIGAKSSLGYLLLLSVFGTAMAKTLFNKLIHISSPIFSSSVTYLIPIVAIFWGVLDGERLFPGQIIAGSVILFGVYLTNKGK